MSKQCVLIGGSFDLTKMTILHDMKYIRMHKPIHLKTVAFYSDKTTSVNCEELVYRLICESPNGVLIYELDE